MPPLRVSGRLSNQNERFTKVETAYASLQQRNTYSEIADREIRLDKREKDKRHRLSAYSNLMLKSHAADLFDVEKICEDVFESAGSACPDLAAQFRHAAHQGSEQMDTGLVEGHVPAKALMPLFHQLGRLQFEVDTMVHNLESCCTSKVGYKAMREEINLEVDGDSAFSGSRSDRDYWSSIKTHREKKRLQTMAHAKALKAPAMSASGNSSQGGAEGGARARTPAQITKRKLRNMKSRKQANARKKLAKAEEAKKKSGADKGASADS